MENKNTENDKVTVSRQIIEQAGKLATLCRSITGGSDLNGFPVQPANVTTIGQRVEALRKCLDEYDRLIVESCMDK